MTDPKATSSMVRIARKHAGYTQADLAKHAGLATRTVTTLETGRKTIFRPETLRAIADVLDLDHDTLVAAYSGEPSTPASPPARKRGQSGTESVSTDPLLFSQIISAISRVIDADTGVENEELHAAISALAPLSAQLFTIYAHVVLDHHPGDYVVADMLATQLVEHKSDTSKRRDRLVARLEHMEKRHF